MMEKYVIGVDFLPRWLARLFQPYESASGIKYEVWGKHRTLTASQGDVLTVIGSRWWITKNKQEHHQGLKKPL